jgi:lactate permease
MLPDVISGLFSIVCLMVLLKFWKPKSVWHFKEEPVQKIDTKLNFSTGQIVRAWSPFIIMTVMIVAWGLQPVKDFLNSIGQVKFNIPGLVNAIIQPNGSPLAIKPFSFNYLSNAGTSILIAAIISMPLIGFKFKSGVRAYLHTLQQLKFPIITIAAVVGFAFIVNNSGMSTTMALALASTGALFPFFSPILGWLGVFLTGSDTSSNALFGRLQHTSANVIGVDPVITVAANATGGVTGKMISPQSIAVGVAAVGLVGRESELFRFTVKHSFIMLFLVCIITVLQAYVFTWFVPAYNSLEKAIATSASNLSAGFHYLLILGIVVLSFVLIVLFLNRKKN